MALGRIGPRPRRRQPHRHERRGVGPGCRLGNTPEARRQVVWFTYVIEMELRPDEDTIAFWSEQLRTGRSYLDMRITLISAGYPESSRCCSSHAPPVRPECVPD